MERLTEHQYRTLEDLAEDVARDRAVSLEVAVETIRRQAPVAVLEPTCRHCGYDVDDDGNCAFCGETTLPAR